MNREHEQPVRSLGDLPQGIAPQRDLWPGIQAQLTPRRRAWIVPASLAAGLMVVAIGLTIGLQVRERQMTAAAQARSDALVLTAVTGNPDIQRDREALLRELPARLEALSPEAQQRVRDSLATVQKAVKDIEAELGRESGNVLLQELLISTWQEEMRVLIAVNELDGPNPEI